MTFLSTPVYVETDVKKNFVFKSSAAQALEALTKGANRLNELRQAEAAKTNHMLASMKAKVLTESEILEMLVQRATQEDWFQVYLADPNADLLNPGVKASKK